MSQTEQDHTSRRWAAAVAKYESARRASEEFDAPRARAYADLLAVSPPELLDQGPHGPRRRWTSVDFLRDDILLTPSDREALVVPVEEQCRRARAYFSRQESSYDDRRSEELYRECWVAERVLIRTPAPNIEAAIFKAEVVARDIDDDKFGFADLGRAAFDLSGYLEQRMKIAPYLDLLRLAGRDDPIVHLEDFSPREWVNSYEAAGGLVSEQNDALLIFSADEGPAAAGGTFEAELDATPWKYRAVQLAAERRASEGGDPIFEAGGRSRLSPLRSFRRVIRVTFAAKDGAPVPVVQTWTRSSGERLELEAQHAA